VCRSDLRLERAGVELDSMAIQNAGNSFVDEYEDD
jgi:hypothetical protein